MRSESANHVELVILRRAITVLRRQVGRPTYQPPGRPQAPRMNAARGGLFRRFAKVCFPTQTVISMSSNHYGVKAIADERSTEMAGKQIEPKRPDEAKADEAEESEAEPGKTMSAKTFSSKTYSSRTHSSRTHSDKVR